MRKNNDIDYFGTQSLGNFELESNFDIFFSVSDLLIGPNEEQLIRVREELNEDPERLAHNLNIFKKWTSFQPHLPKNIEDRLLSIFLRGCKHDLERAKRKLELFYNVRRNCPDIYSNRNPNDSDIQLAARMV